MAANIIIVVLIAGYAVFVIRRMHKRKKQGFSCSCGCGGGCSGNCAGCSGCTGGGSAEAAGERKQDETSAD